MRDDQFLSDDGRFIVCSTHGALFRIEDGHCLDGPCVGQALERVEIDCDEAGRVRLMSVAVDEPPAGGACHRPGKCK
jgi:nitrite reductase/ring-hydroxylating ferredoxin subunit